MWKKRLGSLATYQELINVFESTGYHAYVETVRNIACHIKDDSNDYAEPLSQPETYPQPKPSPPSSPKLATRRFSSCDEFLQINSADAQDLPEGESYSYSVTSDSYPHNVIMMLFSLMFKVISMVRMFLNPMMCQLYPCCLLRSQKLRLIIMCINIITNINFHEYLQAGRFALFISLLYSICVTFHHVTEQNHERAADLECIKTS